MLLGDHPHVLSVHIELESDADALVTFRAVIETDLELNASSPQYKADKVDDLLRAVQAYLKANGSVDKSTIKQRR